MTPRITICPPGYAIGYVPQASARDFHELEQDTLTARMEQGRLKTGEKFIRIFDPVYGNRFIKVKS